MAAIARAPAGRAQGRGQGPRRSLSPGTAPSGRFLRGREGSGAPSGPGSAAHSLLSRVAQLENRILRRKKQMELQDAELGRKALEEESSSSVCSQKRGRNGPRSQRSACGSGSRRESAGVKLQLDLESEEEEMGELMESSLGASRGKGSHKKNKTPVPPGREISPTEASKGSFHNKDSEESGFGRVTSPAPSSTSRNLSGHTMRSSMKDNTAKISVPGTGYTKQSQESLGSDRSEIKSLDDLFSQADDAEDPTSSSSNEFRLNILSLDDLAPDIPSEAEEFKQKGENIQVTQGSNKYVKRETLLEGEDQGTRDVSDVSEGDVGRTVSEAEISEHFSGVSTDFPEHKQDYSDQDEETLNSEYSEDFERSLSPSESVSRMSEGPSGQEPSSASSVTRERLRRGQGVPVRDTGVQTAGPPFSYCWAKASTSAVLSPPTGTSYIDPVPVASHVISRDAVEALTAYSPSVLTLHAMFKQHLMWTQQFVEKIHHLHSALVESLEQDKFHYHTLEEAKEYIKNHKPPPLTFEQALEEIQRAQEE